jgi:hypothetical protein
VRNFSLAPRAISECIDYCTTRASTLFAMSIPANEVLANRNLAIAASIVLLWEPLVDLI